MTATELLPLLRKLNRAEKLYTMQFLVSDLAQEESDLLQPDLAYAVWSPSDAYDAADTMLNVLAESKTDDSA